MKKKEKRQRRSLWKSFFILLFGDCQVCAKSRADYITDCRRVRDRSIMVCEKCSAGFAHKVEIQPTFLNLEMN